MIWFLMVAALLIGTPLLMFSLAALSTEIGLPAVIWLGFALLVLASALSLPAMLSVVVSCTAAWLVYRAANRLPEGES